MKVQLKSNERLCPRCGADSVQPAPFPAPASSGATGVLWRKVRGMPSVKTPSVSRDEPASGVLGKRERFRSKPLGGAIFAYSALGEITQILASSGSPK